MHKSHLQFETEANNIAGLDQRISLLFFSVILLVLLPPSSLRGFIVYFLKFIGLQQPTNEEISLKHAIWGEHEHVLYR